MAVLAVSGAVGVGLLMAIVVAWAIQEIMNSIHFRRRLTEIQRIALTDPAEATRLLNELMKERS